MNVGDKTFLLLNPSSQTEFPHPTIPGKRFTVYLLLSLSRIAGIIGTARITEPHPGMLKSMPHTQANALKTAPVVSEMDGKMR